MFKGGLLTFASLDGHVNALLKCVASVGLGILNHHVLSIETHVFWKNPSTSTDVFINAQAARVFALQTVS